MALAFAQYEDLFQLVRGYLYWRKNGLTNQVQDSLYSYVYCRDGIVTFDRGGSYICLPRESNSPNLDEPLKGFIMNPACSPWKCFESYKPGHMGHTTHGKSVQPL